MREAIQTHQPNLIVPGNNRLASVAMILRDLDTEPSVLFIERAKNENDPWSGQIAFPGGNMERKDGSIVDTAIRETSEEVGLELQKSAVLGRIDDQQGKNNYREIPLIISCVIFETMGDHERIHSQEVGDSFWIGIDHLRNPDNRINYQTEYAPDPYPGIDLSEGRVLWGLTYRFVEGFLRLTQNN